MLKKYKIRLTSKKTGKKIDINIDINQNKATLGKLPVEPLGAPTLNLEEKNKVIGDLGGVLGENNFLP